MNFQRPTIWKISMQKNAKEVKAASPLKVKADAPR